MNKKGRPRWQLPDFEKVEELASHGLTQAQIALALGISESTLYEKKKTFSEFSEAIKRGQAKGIEAVANALWDSAVGSGNVTAMIFYLKNRSPEAWSDKKELQHMGEVSTPLAIDDAHATRIAESFLARSRCFSEQQSRASEDQTS